MAIITYDEVVINTFPEVFNYVENSALEKTVMFVINSQYRNAVKLKDWLKNELENNSITYFVDKKYNEDQRVMLLLQKVMDRIQYKRDSEQFKLQDYWQTPNQTWFSREGDCEDGAILLYALCREAGIPENRLKLMCGDIEAGGHCWLAYRPTNKPLCWVFLDWCYEPTLQEVNKRPTFIIEGKDIIEHHWNNKKKCFVKIENSKYKKMWFAFSENKSYLSFKTKV